MLKKVYGFIGVVLFAVSYAYAELPVSKEASIIEVVSSSEVSVKAVGIYRSEEKSRRKRKKDVKHNGQAEAIGDAKRAAVYYLIYNGTDPLISTEEEIDRFNKIEDDVFSDDIINELIMFSESSPHKVMTIDRGEGVKVHINLKINTAFLRQLLEENKVIFSKKELSEELGYPQIIVLPVVPNGSSPIEALETDAKKQHAAGVIESFLTSKLYDVIVPTQLNAINDLSKSIQSAKSIQQDSVYQLALSIGSDIYLDYSLGETKGAYDTDQIAVTLRAYETTTGRLLATETGYSKPRVGEEYVSIEEALLTALANLTQRIMRYWEEDLNRGVQYKVLSTITKSNLTEEMLEEVQEDLLDSFDEVCKSMKENVVTDRSVDVSLWCDHEQISDSRKLYKAIRSKFKANQDIVELKQINRNRKLILLELR